MKSRLNSCNESWTSCEGWFAKFPRSQPTSLIKWGNGDEKTLCVKSWTMFQLAKTSCAHDPDNSATKLARVLIHAVNEQSVSLVSSFCSKNLKHWRGTLFLRSSCSALSMHERRNSDTRMPFPEEISRFETVCTIDSTSSGLRKMSTSINKLHGSFVRIKSFLTIYLLHKDL